MKKLLGIVAATAALISICHQDASAADPIVSDSTALITVNVSGTLSAPDRRAARFIVTSENVARIAAGTNSLPTSPPAALKASYETVLTRIVSDAHKSYIATANKEASKNLTADQIDLLNATVADLLNSGVTPEAIISAVKAAK